MQDYVYVSRQFVNVGRNNPNEDGWDGGRGAFSIMTNLVMESNLLQTGAALILQNSVKPTCVPHDTIKNSSNILLLV